MKFCFVWSAEKIFTCHWQWGKRVTPRTVALKVADCCCLLLFALGYKVLCSSDF